ncbi:hypothetical protein Tco_0133580 [Tanacetum coccineum]
MVPELTIEAIKDSESYKEYYAIASGAEPPKTKASVKKKQVGSDKTKTPPTAKGKRLKTLAKLAKPTKKKQPEKTSKAKGLKVLSEAALTETEQMKLDEEEDDEVGMNDNDDDDDADNQDDDGQEYDGQDDDNEQTDTDNDGDDFVHPKFLTNDQEDRHNEEDIQEEGSDLRMDEEETNEVEEVDELYRDVNVNLEGRDTKMTDVPRNTVQTTQVIEDTHVIITPVNPEDVPVTTIAETPLSSITTLPPPPIFSIQPLQQTPVPAPTIAPSSSLQDLPNFGSLFGFDHRLKTLENDFSEFKQTNQFAATFSSIPGIVDTYLANKMNEAVKTTVQLQSDRLKDEAQTENEDFINTLDDSIKKIIKEQVLNRSSNESKTSHVVAANLSELEMKKILIDKMERNKSIHRSDEQKNLYKALVDAYKSDKIILDIYGDTVTMKRHQDDQDDDKEPSAGSNRGSKRRRAGKEPESISVPKEKTSKSSGKSKEGSKSHHTSTGKSAQVEEPIHADEDLEEPAH